MARGNPFSNPYAPKTERIPLIGNHTNRDGSSVTKDQIYYNVMPYSMKNEVTETKKVWLEKRGGFAAEITVDAGGGVGRGIFYWAETDTVYSVIDDKVYANTASIHTLATATGTCWFEEYKGTEHLLILCDGTDMLTIDTSNTVTDISDADLPTGPITPVFFDSYIFVAKSGTPEIYNSNVDDPELWDAGDFLSAEQYADDIVSLIRQVNYVVAFGATSVEFFFDAENVSGSPLERNEGISLKVGLAARDTVQQMDRRIIWVAQTANGDPSVWMFEGLTASEVSTEFVNRMLKNEAASLANATAWLCRHKGHVLYVLNLTSRTLVYDVDEQMWFDWSINSSGSHAVLPFKYATEGADHKTLVLHNTDGKIYLLNPVTHTDDAGAILVEIITDKVDFGTNNWKQQLEFVLVGDIQSTGTVTLSWTDDDYQTYRDSRSLSMSAGRAYTKAGGIFRRRAYKLLHSTNAAFRVEAVELSYQLRSS